MSTSSGPSHADVCRKRKGEGPCGCCDECGNHSFAADDGRCLYCQGRSAAKGGPARKPSAPRAPRPKASPPAAPSLLEQVPEPVVVSSVAEFVEAFGPPLVCRSCGSVLEGTERAPCDCGGEATPLESEPVLEFAPLEFAPVANAIPANVSPEHPEPAATERAWVPCPGGCGVLKAAGEATTCRSCGPVVPVLAAPVSNAADADIVARETPGIVGNASPCTSHAAAAAVPTGKRRVQVLTALARTGVDGATAEEMEGLTGLGGSTVRPRLLELERDRFVERTDRNRATRSGMAAVVYAVTPRGQAAVERLAQ